MGRESFVLRIRPLTRRGSKQALQVGPTTSYHEITIGQCVALELSRSKIDSR